MSFVSTLLCALTLCFSVDVPKAAPPVFGERVQTFTASAAASHNYSVSVVRWPTINAVRVKITQNANWTHQAENLLGTGPHTVYFGRRMKEPTLGIYTDNNNATIFNVGVTGSDIVYNNASVPTISQALRIYDGTTDYAGLSGCTLAQSPTQTVVEEYVDKTPFEGTGSVSMHIGSTGASYALFYDNGSGTNIWTSSDLNNAWAHTQSATIEVIYEIP